MPTYHTYYIISNFLSFFHSHLHEYLKAVRFPGIDDYQSFQNSTKAFFLDTKVEIMTQEKND
jgi:hypothetical protein